jgi:hypothetical protein
LVLLPCRNLFDYDQVVNTQRDRVYAERRRALLSGDLSPLMQEYAEKTCDDILEVGKLAGGMMLCRRVVVVGCSRRAPGMWGRGGRGQLSQWH